MIFNKTLYILFNISEAYKKNELFSKIENKVFLILNEQIETIFLITKTFLYENLIDSI